MVGTNNPSFIQLLKNPVHFLAFGFGAGLSPKAPGTFGTLVAIPLYILICALSLPWYVAVVVVCCVLGIFICGQTANDLGVHDHGGIVWDEIAGFLIALTAVPLTWWNIVLAFVLFRFFDILKPWPISWLDKNVHSGLGIMLDDIVAGVFAWAILLFLNFVVLI